MRTKERNIRKKTTGFTWSEEQRKNMSNIKKETHKGIKKPYLSFAGRTHSNISIEKMKKNLLTREMCECPHCKIVITKPNFVRWHGDKCKFK